MEELKKTILIIDDDEEARRFYREVFSAQGFTALVARDGLEGLDIAIREKPDIIFTGIIMPRMDGFELIKNLKNNVATDNIPVVMFSHLGREEDKRKAHELGVRDFIVRSLVTPNEVVERVMALLGSKNVYYLDFDPASRDAAKLSKDFNFAPYFECKNGKRMVLKLIPLGRDQDHMAFKAYFVCQD